MAGDSRPHRQSEITLSEIRAVIIIHPFIPIHINSKWNATLLSRSAFPSFCISSLTISSFPSSFSQSPLSLPTSLTSPSCSPSQFLSSPFSYRRLLVPLLPSFLILHSILSLTFSLPLSLHILLFADPDRCYLVLLYCQTIVPAFIRPVCSSSEQSDCGYIVAFPDVRWPL